MGTSDTPIGSLLHVVFAVSLLRFHFPRVNNVPDCAFTSTQSILEVFILCLAGYILAGRGVLDKKTQKVCFRSFTYMRF